MKARTSSLGRFSFELEAGEYDLLFSGVSIEPRLIKVDLQKDTSRLFLVLPRKVKANQIKVESDRIEQKNSRQVMKPEMMKQVPGAMGDPLVAMTTLPGINRTGPVLGNLVIRGVSPTRNIFLVDGVPVMIPQHFGGLHSIISTEMIRDIEIYSSAFPATYGDGLGALVQINTVDNVNQLGGAASISLVTSSLEMHSDIENNKETVGYWILAARRSYFEVTLPAINFVPELSALPVYYDYQAKGKYILGKKNSITLFLFGSWDKFSFFKGTREGSNDQFSFYNLAFYHDFTGKNLNNRIILFRGVANSNTLRSATIYADSTGFDSSETRPHFWGAKDNFSIQPLQFMKLNTGFEIRANEVTSSYRFVSGLNNSPGQDVSFDYETSTSSIRNTYVATYLETVFNIQKFRFVPGSRVNHLDAENATQVDLRGLVAYELAPKTEISLAGGRYSAFQNSNLTRLALGNYSASGSTPAETAIHSVLGVQKQSELVTYRLEAFYNYIESYDTYSDFNGSFLNAGYPYRTTGFEVSLRKDQFSGRSGFFGWGSYSYARSERLTNPYQGPTGFDQVHTLNLVAGYSFSVNTVALRAQYYTSLPYTDIIASTFDSVDNTHDPVYGSYNAQRFAPRHRIDIRYTRNINYRWGKVSWYLEIINVTNATPVDDLQWDYSQPFNPGSNPVPTKSWKFLAIIPSFGFEAQF